MMRQLTASKSQRLGTQDFILEKPKPEAMSASDTARRPVTSSVTEVAVVTGERYRVEGEPKDVERIILDAARGSIMQLAWLVEVGTGENLAVNPEHVVTLRAVGS